LSEKEVENRLDELVRKNEISKREDSYYFNFGTKNDSINSRLYYHCDDKNGLYRFGIILSDLNLNYNKLNNPKLVKIINSKYAKGFKYSEVITRDISEDLAQEKINELDMNQYWVKNNLVIQFKHVYIGTEISFNNACVTGGTELLNFDMKINKMASESSKTKVYEQNNFKVQNSVWNGSVREVEKYLKSTLKDPDSYESIEWGSVVETSSGYKVRHKYRAKNSLGGYIIENAIFNMDKDGNVLNVETF